MLGLLMPCTTCPVSVSTTCPFRSGWMTTRRRPSLLNAAISIFGLLKELLPPRLCGCLRTVSRSESQQNKVVASPLNPRARTQTQKPFCLPNLLAVAASHSRTVLSLLPATREDDHLGRRRGTSLRSCGRESSGPRRVLLRVKASPGVVYLLPSWCLSHRGSGGVRIWGFRTRLSG